MNIMEIITNGAENNGKKRIPRGDVSDYVGPMPNLQDYIDEDENEEER